MANSRQINNISKAKRNGSINTVILMKQAKKEAFTVTFRRFSVCTDYCLPTLMHAAHE